MRGREHSGRGAGNGKAFHDLDAVSGKDREVRMIEKELGGGLVRLRSDYGVRGHIVPDVGDP